MYPCACAHPHHGRDVRVVGEHRPGGVPGGREVPRVVREDRRIEVHEPDGVAVDDARPRLGGRHSPGRTCCRDTSVGIDAARARRQFGTRPLRRRHPSPVREVLRERVVDRRLDGATTRHWASEGGVVPSEHRCKRGVPAGATVWGSVGHSSGSASFGATGGVTKNLLCLTQLRQSNFESRFYSILSADRPISVARDCLLWLGYVLNHISLYIIRYRRETRGHPVCSRGVPTPSCD